MKREFLRGLDLGDGVKLPDAIVDTIMAEHGKDVEAHKTAVTSLTTERDSLQTQLTEAQNKLSGMEDWESKYATDTQALQTQLSALQKDIDTRNIRDKVSAATGVPTNLLTGDTEEACKSQADAILQWQGTLPKYPDATGVGGDPAASGGGATRDQFAEWAAAALNKS